MHMSEKIVQLTDVQKHISELLKPDCIHISTAAAKQVSFHFFCFAATGVRHWKKGDFTTQHVWLSPGVVGCGAHTGEVQRVAQHGVHSAEDVRVAAGGEGRRLGVGAVQPAGVVSLQKKKKKGKIWGLLMQEGKKSRLDPEKRGGKKMRNVIMNFWSCCFLVGIKIAPSARDVGVFLLSHLAACFDLI